MASSRPPPILTTGRQRVPPVFLTHTSTLKNKTTIFSMPIRPIILPSHLIDPAHQPDSSWGGIPFSVSHSLQLSEPLHLSKAQRPLAKNLRKTMSRKGISRLALSEKMNGTRRVKALRLIDAATRGEVKNVDLIRFLFQCLEVSEDSFNSMLLEEKAFEQLHHDWQLLSSVHGSFHHFGPHLKALLLDDVEDCRPRFCTPYRYLCARVAFHTTDQEIDPPSASSVASGIEQDVTWLPRVAKQYVRAYIYYRMPNEVYVISPQGDILLSGDWHYYITPHVQLLLQSQKSASQSSNA
jgi:hypothetical protein